MTDRAPVASALFDASLFLVAVYLGIRLRLQAQDGVLPEVVGLAALVAATLVLVALALVRVRLDGFGRRGRAGLAIEVASWAAIMVGLGGLGARAPSSLGNFWWLAQEWTKLPSNLVLMARLSPLATGCGVLAFVASVALLVRGGARARFAVTALGLAVAAVIVAGLSRIGADQRVVVYWAIFAAPWVAAALASAVGVRHLAWRALVVAFAGGLMVVHYLAWLPLAHGGLDEIAAARRIYPPAGKVSEIPLAFLREIVVDREAGRLFSAYGPASGIISVDLASGQLELRTTPNELVRHLWSEPGQPEVVALDWVQGDLLRITKHPFRIAGKRALISPTRSVPMAFVVGEERMLVVFSELPGLLEIERDSARPLRELNFRELGYTAYRSGAWAVAGQIDQGFVIVELGAVDRAGRYLLLRVDLDRFEVTAQVELPEGGLGLLHVPQHDALYAASFFSDRIYEFNASRLEATARGSLRGPLNTRALLHEPQRDLLFALGFLSGELHVIELESGATRCVVPVGNKSMSLALDSSGQWLYVGSRDGIFELRLDALLADRSLCRDGQGGS